MADGSLSSSASSRWHWPRKDRSKWGDLFYSTNPSGGRQIHWRWNRRSKTLLSSRHTSCLSFRSFNGISETLKKHIRHRDLLTPHSPQSTSLLRLGREPTSSSLLP